MNKRLLWNFEIKAGKPIDFTKIEAKEKEDLIWETRFFWSEQEPIILTGLDEGFLIISNYEIKQRADRYYLLPDYPYNIKQRRDELLYKPLIKEKQGLCGYGKKINLINYPPQLSLPGTKQLSAQTLLNQLERHQQEIAVTKEALIYKLPCAPKIKLELARLVIQKQIYFSLCIEGRSESLVGELAKHLLGKQLSCDYVRFLKTTFKP